MEGTTVETPQPTQDQTTESNTARIAESRQQYEIAARLGRGLLGITQERENRRLTPWVSGTRFDQADVLAVRNRHQSEEITEADIAEARRGSVGLSLETAAQVAEAQLPRTGGVNENLSSLEDLIKMIKSGHASIQGLLKDNSSVIVQEARKAIARRQRVAPERVNLTDQQLLSFTEEQYQKASQRLGRGAEMLRSYFGR